MSRLCGISQALCVRMFFVIRPIYFKSYQYYELLFLFLLSTA